MNQYYIVKDKPSKNPEGRWLSGPETKWVEPIEVLKIPEVEGLNIVRNLNQKIEDLTVSGMAACGSLVRENDKLRKALEESREIHESMRPDLPVDALLRLSMQYHKVIDDALRVQT